MQRRRLVGRHPARQGPRPAVRTLGGDESAARPRISVIDYDERELVERGVETADQCLAFRDKPTVTWINVDGLGDASVVAALCSEFRLHPLVAEDILNTEQRPKAEDFDDYLYIALKMLQWDAPRRETNIEHVSVVLGAGFVLSFQERPGDVFEPIRDRIRQKKGRIRQMGADYLAYRIMDSIVDGYFVVLERRGELIEALEDDVMTEPSRETLRRVYALKREGLFIRKSIWPAREVASALERSESSLISGDIRMYIRDIYGNTTHAIDTAEALREMLSGMLDTYLSSLSNRMNEVMKVLTIIATIFIPLTFVAGVYGMNFEHMPELKWAWAYPAVWGVMFAVAVVMLVYFRKKRWL